MDETETIAALLLDGWKDDMDDEIDAINYSSKYTPASSGFDLVGFVKGWIQEKRLKLYEIRLGQLSARSFTTNQ